MTLSANWSYPTNIRFGVGRINEIAVACSAAGISRPLLVTDKGLADLEITHRTLDMMDAAGLGRNVFAEVDPNPNEKNAEEGVRAYGVAGQSRPLWDFEDVDDWWTRANADAIAPVVAVPTTAGTGSEVGRASVISNTQTAEKKIIFHPKMLPAMVICDPELTVGMPQYITAGTGLDAFAHCVEAYSSPHYHPMSQGIALEGMRLVKENLPKAYTNGTDLEARANMMSAASMGATAFQKGLGAIHALSHPIGAVHHTHHGTTNAVCMPAVLRFNEPAIRARFQPVAAFLNIEGGFDGFCHFVDEFNDLFAIPKTLTELGVKNANVDALVDAALRDPSVGGNPVKMTIENTSKLLEIVL